MQSPRCAPPSRPPVLCPGHWRQRSGGGAGIAADLRAFAAAGAFGCAAIAVVTVQSTSGLASARVIDAGDLRAQITAVGKHQRVGAIKIGALGSAANARVVAAWLGTQPQAAVVLDPVMRPTRGRARLLAKDALAALREGLLPRTTVVTANASEAAAILGRRVKSAEDAHAAAVALCALGARAALVKGGHLAGPRAVDTLALAAIGRVLTISGPRRRLPPVHGGGCTLASLIAGKLAVWSLRAKCPSDRTIVRAVRWARRIHQRALVDAVDVGGPMRVLVP